MSKFYPTNDAPSCIHSTLTLFLLFLLFSVFIHVPANAQVNAYARITAVNAGKTILTIANLDQTNGNFGNGKQVIVIQMQDNVIGNTNTSSASFGSLGNIASAGLFEVATVQTFTPSQITLTRALKNNYHTDDNSRLQIVSFNQLGNPNFTTSRDIRALRWNGNIGGIVAFQVAGDFELLHNITADSAGFRGGNASGNYSNTTCNSTQYANASPNYGTKGEGIYRSINNAYTCSRGNILNGGGGGNGYNGGGGGGGNISAGGLAGTGRNCGQQTGGLGGISLLASASTGNRLFMGGGGGGGQGDNSDQSSGGNGGGIVIIKANRLVTGYFDLSRISANGASAENAEGADGAGGGGAAGSILLQINNYDVNWLSFMLVNANGGSGGDVEHTQTHGGGGGGGQGAILFSGSAPTGNILYTTWNGQGGDNNSGGTSQAGDGVGAPNQGVIPDIGTPLPVRLLNFNAAKSDTKSKLTWTTTDEVNTVFDIQHSTNGVEFTTVGTVNGTGVANAITNYSFLHNMPARGNNFYRLQMTEIPNFRSYSAITTVDFNDLPETPLAWPNPVKDHFNVRLTDVDNNTIYEITISDLAGKIVLTSSLRPVNNIIKVLTGNQLRQGLYIASIATATRKHFVKLIVQ